MARMKAESKRFLMETSDVSEAYNAAELSSEEVKALFYQFLKFGVLCENATVTGSGTRSRSHRLWFEPMLTYFFYKRVWNSYVQGSRTIFFCFENHLNVKLLNYYEQTKSLKTVLRVSKVV